jgi:GntR family transcriptional regulator
MRIRRDVPIPYYYQLIQLLREEMERGTWSADTPIPSEHELCTRYGVSRTVVRQALGELVASGLLYRVKGKGTFVARRKLEEKFIQRSDGFYREMTSRGLSVATSVLDQRLVLPPPHVRQYLHLDEVAPVIKIDRLRSVEGEVLLFVQTYIPSALCPDLVHADLSESSLYAVLRDSYGLAVASGTRTVEAVLAQPPISRLLHVRKGAALLKVDSVSYLSDGRPLEYYEAWHRGDRSKFEIEMVVGPPAATPLSPVTEWVAAGSRVREGSTASGTAGDPILTPQTVVSRTGA